MKTDFTSTPSDAAVLGARVVLAYKDGRLSSAAQALDEATGGILSRALSTGVFAGEAGQVMDVVAPPGLAAARLLVVGIGEAEAVTAEALELAGAHAYRALRKSGVRELQLEFDADPEGAARAALGVHLAAYRFDRYKTRKPAGHVAPPTAATVVVADPEQARAAFADLGALAEGVFLCRDLVSEPANVLYPEAFAGRLQALDIEGLEVEILGEAEMTALGMGALLGVGQGSARQSQLAVLRWNGGADAGAAPLCFVGKGVCFDTGGVSIKPAANMDEMKTDMAGAGAIAGVMAALARRKARLNVVAVLGLVENMLDGAAQRPGDVVVSMSGQTIEVIDTDAEGRLVLADALWYAQDRFKPRAIVDLATLTGANIVALGPDLAGLYCNDDELAGRVERAARGAREDVWRMPLPARYEKMIDSDIADVKNLGERWGGAISAALFLQRFVGETAWGHLDMGAPCWRKNDDEPTAPKGASGYGVRLLNALASGYEDAAAANG